MLRAASFNTGGVAITGGSIGGTVTGVAQAVFAGGTPFMSPPSGTMGNNGAFVLGTVSPIVYPSVWMYFTAGQIAAGVPATAGWYAAQMSDTTHATVSNNTYTSGNPAFPSSLTPFVTTGTGAITGDTGEEFGPMISLPALTGNSSLFLSFGYTACTNNANAKTTRFRLSGTGGTVLLSYTTNSVASASWVGRINNVGDTGHQTSYLGNFGGATATTTNGGATGTVDTSVATTLVQSVQKATATDVLVLLPPDVYLAR